MLWINVLNFTITQILLVEKACGQHYFGGYLRDTWDILDIFLKHQTNFKIFCFKLKQNKNYIKSYE